MFKITKQWETEHRKKTNGNSKAKKVKQEECKKASPDLKRTLYTAVSMLQDMHV